MSSHPEPGAPARSGPVRDPQGLVAGLALLGLALFALWAMSGLPRGTLRAMGPAMLPYWLALGVGICGLLLVILSFLQAGSALERWSVRGPLLVLLAILTFALTIRPFPLGGVSTPGLGLIAAGPLAIIIGGHATPEARLRDLLILALSLTAFCMVLFGDLLNLPIPMFPQALSDRLPGTLSNDNRLRLVAGTLALAALLIYLATRRRSTGAIDVADHAGRL